MSVFAFGAELHRKNLHQSEQIKNILAPKVPQRVISKLSQKTDSKVEYKRNQLPSNSSNKKDESAIRHQLSDQYKGKVFQKVGDCLIDKINLMKNAPSNEVKSQSPCAINAQNKASLDKEVEELLGKRSLHSEEADDEWFATYSKRMKQLSQREYMQEKAASIQKVHIKAFQCVDCNGFITEELPSLCRQRGHKISAISTVKRFFECANCKRRDFTLGGGLLIEFIFSNENSIYTFVIIIVINLLLISISLFSACLCIFAICFIDL